MEYLSKEYWLHWRINQRFFMKTAYDHPQIGQIVNNALFKRKDETYKLEWRKCWNDGVIVTRDTILKR